MELANLPVQYLDCDVEEPNGGFFLKPDTHSESKVTADVPTVDLNKCTGCGKCEHVCQFNAIISLGQANVLTFEQLCHSCGGCIRLCPENAIIAKPVPIGKMLIGRAGDINFAAGRLKVGSIRAVAMIRHLKQHINTSGFALLDAPPGTSCPVVEATRGADLLLLVTEPTPFGLSDLQLAVGMARELKVPFAVVINRDGSGDEKVADFCAAEGIDILLRIPDDIRIARTYSTGRLLVEEMPVYRGLFERLAEITMGRLQ
jgi:MinD superfamily P-loop ATPase